MGEFHYILIPEQHKNGVLHIHMIATNTLTQKWWKDNAYKSGFGYMSKIKPMNSAGNVPYYISKYIGKDSHEQVWPKHFRRVRKSGKWPLLPEIEVPNPYDYEVYKTLHAARWEVLILLDIGYDVGIHCEIGIDT